MFDYSHILHTSLNLNDLTRHELLPAMRGPGPTLARVPPRAFFHNAIDATVWRAFRPILLDQRPQWIARNTNGARRSPQHYIVVRRKDSPWVPEQSFRRF